MTRPRVQISAEALYFVTGNQNKVREANDILDCEQYELDTPEPQSMDEHEIAHAKMHAARQELNEPFFVEDISLRTDALNGLPGPFVKYFVKNLSLEKIAQIAAGPAQVICTIGYFDGEQEHVIQSVIDGSIVAPRGEDWGFNPVFEHAATGQTLAQMTGKTFAEHSHRSQALEKLKRKVFSTDK